MVHDLLDLTRLETHRLKLDVGEVSLSKLLFDVVAHQSVLTPDREIKLNPEDEVVVHGDRDRLQQIVENLLSNAVKYGDADQPIEVNLARRQGQVEIAVTNRGSGLSTEQLERLFQRFSGGGASAGSLGLGLHIAKGLVEAHGGTITVSSEPGAETTFRVTLPVPELHVTA